MVRKEGLTCGRMPSTTGWKGVGALGCLPRTVLRQAQDERVWRVPFVVSLSKAVPNAWAPSPSPGVFSCYRSGISLGRGASTATCPRTSNCPGRAHISSRSRASASTRSPATVRLEYSEFLSASWINRTLPACLHSAESQTVGLWVCSSQDAPRACCASGDDLSLIRHTTNQEFLLLR